MILTLEFISIFNRPVAAGEMAGLAGWQWLLICLAAILIVGWLLTSAASFSASSPYIDSLTSHAAAEGHTGTSAAQLQPASQDDLKIIEGIGPKIEALLKAEGIATYAQLAQSDVLHLKELLLAAGLRVNDPSTWPEQANLAAREEWASLEALQGSLKGGRKV